MGSYKIEWKGSAEKELRKLDPSNIRQIIQLVALLEENPLPQGYRKLHGAQHQYRIRTGDYRVIYEFDPETKVVTIYHVRHRKDAYRR
ncbi:MAG: type II toxin-antitoxin system RelE/ParE family toxin [Thermodesulfobacteriota bacterium]